MDKTGSNQELGVEKVAIEVKATEIRAAIFIFMIYSANLLIIP